MVGQFTHFVNGTTTASFGAGITVNAVNVTSATTATVNITISALADVGTRTVTLTTGGQMGVVARRRLVLQRDARCRRDHQVSPASGRQAESLSVTVTGTNTHFANGSTAFSFGGGITLLRSSSTARRARR